MNDAQGKMAGVNERTKNSEIQKFKVLKFSSSHLCLPVSHEHHSSFGYTLLKIEISENICAAIDKKLRMGLVLPEKHKTKGFAIP